MAWDVFGEGNGTADLEGLRARVRALSPRTSKDRVDLDYQVGCISIAFPVFFAPDDWVEVPHDWSANIVSGRTYDLSSGPGRELWDACTARAAGRGIVDTWAEQTDGQPRYGAPVSIEPRLGQGSFRLAVLDAYDRACAVTTEHSLPVLEAAHIRPYSQGGPHAVSNGLPLRRDLHRLFDLGFVTVRPDLTFAVSTKLRDEYANGRVYYALAGRKIAVPRRSADRPDASALEWHGDAVFRG
jgi:putative restriction endonuclease